MYNILVWRLLLTAVSHTVAVLRLSDLCCVDPRVADYFMMSSPWASLIICVVYVIVVEWALPRFMDSRKPLEFRPLIVIYNFAMVLLSGYIFVEVCKCIVHFC